MFFLPFLAVAAKTAATISATEYFVMGATAAYTLKNKKENNGK